MLTWWILLQEVLGLVDLLSVSVFKRRLRVMEEDAPACWCFNWWVSVMYMLMCSLYYVLVGMHNKFKAKTLMKEVKLYEVSRSHAFCICAFCTEVFYIHITKENLLSFSELTSDPIFQHLSGCLLSHCAASLNAIQLHHFISMKHNLSAQLIQATYYLYALVI